MRRANLVLLGINAVGGAAVLASYALGLGAHPDPEAALWGEVPLQLRSVYTVSMFGAAGGYFLFLPYLLFAVRPEAVVLPTGRSYRGLYGVFLLILVPSALWMPLTLRFVAEPSAILWWTIRVDLLLVAAGAVALIVALVGMRPRGPGWARALALFGSALFAWQTAILDALVWPLLYRG